MAGGMISDVGLEDKGHGPVQDGVFVIHIVEREKRQMWALAGGSRWGSRSPGSTGTLFPLDLAAPSRVGQVIPEGRTTGTDQGAGAQRTHKLPAAKRRRRAHCLRVKATVRNHRERGGPLQRLARIFPGPSRCLPRRTDDESGSHIVTTPGRAFTEAQECGPDNASRMQRVP